MLSQLEERWEKPIPFDFTFYPQNIYGQDVECGLCGMYSFAHKHKEGDMPEDFVRLNNNK